MVLRSLTCLVVWLFAWLLYCNFHQCFAIFIMNNPYQCGWCVLFRFSILQSLWMLLWVAMRRVRLHNARVVLTVPGWWYWQGLKTPLWLWQNIAISEVNMSKVIVHSKAKDLCPSNRNNKLNVSQMKYVLVIKTSQDYQSSDKGIQMSSGRSVSCS